jgi:hypothetical protein
MRKPSYRKTPTSGHLSTFQPSPLSNAGRFTEVGGQIDGEDGDEPPKTGKRLRAKSLEL